MDDRLKFINYIPAKPDEGMILTRLGYKKTKTILSGEYKENLDRQISHGLMLCNTKGVYGRFRLIQRNDVYVEIENGVRFYSHSLSELLKNSHEVLLMASTVGVDIVLKIEELIKENNASHALVLDAVASETADVGLDFIMDFLSKLLIREGKKLTKMRYSPGYGDLLLQNQKLIYDSLKLEKLNISITEKYILVPEKSVIAIAGIEA